MSFKRKFYPETSKSKLSDEDCRTRGWRRMPEAYFAWWHSERKVQGKGQVVTDGNFSLRFEENKETLDLFAAPYCMWKQPEITNTMTGVTKKVIDCAPDELRREIKVFEKVQEKCGFDSRRADYIETLQRQLRLKNAEIASEMCDLFG
jgi:hypothetical protein